MKNSKKKFEKLLKKACKTYINSEFKEEKKDLKKKNYKNKK